VSGMRRVGLTLERQGHIHIEIVHLLVKRRGVRKWYIQTEQKRPDGFASYSFTIERGLRRPAQDEHDVYLHAREHDPSMTLFWREGEDGSESTVLGIRLPRVWRRSKNWSTHVEMDKWGVFVTSTLEPRVGHWPTRRSRVWTA
jgi:hypothetical protein